MRDQFIGTLSQARFHKMSRRHDLALGCVDECLMQVIKVEPDKEAPFHRWALALYREIADCERNQNKLFLN